MAILVQAGSCANLGEIWAEFVEGCFEIFGKNPGLSNNCHEVGIAYPPRHNVHVKVMLDPSTGTSSEIHSNIEPIRLVGLLERELASLDQF